MTEIVRIDNTTWRIENDYVRFFLLEGDKKAVLIDSGYNCENVKDIVKELTSKELILLCTHGDGDHVSGTGAFSEVYMSEADYVNCKINERFPDTKLVKVKEGDVIDLGNRSLEIYDIPGHTMGSVAILDVEKRRIFTGDSVQKGHVFMFGNHRVPKAYADSLRKIVGLSDKFDTIIASHDEPLLPGDYASKVLESWEEVVNGKVSYDMTELHGQNVKSYDAKYCGFYCE